MVVLVGTKGDETAEDEKGRLLGIMEPTAEPAMSLDFDVRQAPADFDEDGNYKWPFALLNKRASILKDRPLSTALSDRKFNMDAAQGIVALTEEEARHVLDLRRRPIELLSAVRATARVIGQDAARKRAAPRPTTTRRGVMHMRRAPAYTYCMELVGADAPTYKIGWAFDYALRQRGFNHASMPALGGIQYTTKLYQLWDTARLAFAMEQFVLGFFEDRLHKSNREVVSGVSIREIESVWPSAVSTIRLRWAPTGAYSVLGRNEAKDIINDDPQALVFE